jgi:hypothetical protein
MSTAVTGAVLRGVRWPWYARGARPWSGLEYEI